MEHTYRNGLGNQEHRFIKSINIDRGASLKKREEVEEELDREGGF